MTEGISNGITHFGQASRNVASDLLNLTRSHLELVEDELKAQLSLIGRIILVSAASVAASAVAILLGSLALVATLRTLWPSLNERTALALVAVGNVFLAVALVFLARALLNRVSPFCRESLRSWQDSISSIIYRT